MMSPLANDEHQDLATGISTAFRIAVQSAGLGKVRQGVNVSDRRKGWKKNFRCPDVVVYLNGTKAVCYGAFWLGGPDFGVEIISPYDRTREKFDFYAQVGTRELLLVDRAPWRMELYRLEDGRLMEVGRSTVEQPDLLVSAVVPLAFRLISGTERPQVEIVHADGRQQWTV